jgi:cytosine/adenosine deaminase-related metal-dependent hydrolase
MWYHNFIEASGFQPLLAEQRFRHAVDIFREYDRHYSFPAGANSIVPHAPYSVSEELWEKIIHFPGNRLLTIHNQESMAEDELFVLKQGDLLKLYEALGIEISFFQPSGKSSFQTYVSRFLSNQQVICVHNVHTSKDDLLHFKSGLASINIYWCLCPNANLFISGQLPDIELLAGESRNIVLGTDSLASNHQLSIATEMRTIHKHFPLIPVEQLFQWATLNGAKALRMDAVLGSFEKGKQPGVTITEPDFSRTKRLF